MSDQIPKAERRPDVPTLSIVIPVYNEAENLIPLYDRLIKVLAQHSLQSEIIFVDDGSTDQSVEIISDLHARDSRVKLIGFSRNFGHQIAITAGLDFSRGDAVVVMDSDLQHPPELIPQLLEQWQAGYEVVYTIHHDTADAGFLKKVTSHGFYKVMHLLTDVPIPEDSADFRLMDRRAVQALTRLREKDRFVRGLVPWIGFRQIGVPYVTAERHAGRTKYSPLKMLRLALDGIASLSYVPLRLSFYLGLIVSLLGAIYAVYALAVFLAGRALPGWTSLLIVILVISGIQMVMVGLIGEYVGRIYKEVKDRPLYIIRETLGLEDRI